MGQYGALFFYATRKPAEVCGVLSRCLALIAPKSIELISRTLGEDLEWESFLAGDDEKDCDEELPDADAAEEFVGYYMDGRCLSGVMADSPLADRVMKAVQESIPADIRGDYLPTELVLQVGYHDHYECAEVDEGQYFGRAFISVGFSGYSSPCDWDEFRQRVFLIPEVVSVKQDLERILGPLEQCIYWDV